MAENRNGAATDRLRSEFQGLMTAEAERLLVGLGRKLGSTTSKLNDVAEGRSPGFAKLALDSGRKAVEGKGPVRGALEIGASRLKDKAVGLVKGMAGKAGKGAGGGKKPTVIMEQVDVGVPLREAYEQWTRYEEFSTFARGVQDVAVADETTSDWKLKIFWSTRSWKARITDEAEEERIAWTSEGAKGTTKGAVTFHALGENLTRVLLVIEYYPKGLFEKTGNIWRAQGRRARLDLKHYARHVTLRGATEEEQEQDEQDEQEPEESEEEPEETSAASEDQDEEEDEEAEEGEGEGEDEEEEEEPEESRA
ncbi:SRPBCC family protein [Streptomyces sp. NPDC048172]|uniref:SRPBCC family protein n=1 Tax=Streptomyces sp. NPDC048172 TaxID=3365505 RepID=UPI0037133DF9